MSNEEHEIEGIIVDDDPALDYILYEEMLEENRKHKDGGGCLTVFILFIITGVSGVLWYI